MSYVTSYDESKALVKASFSGTSKIDELFSFRDEVANICKKFMCSKLLINMNRYNTTIIKTFDYYYLGESSVPLFRDIKIALVLPVDESLKEDILFTSTIVSNRGLMVKEFDTIDEALNWLDS